MRRRPSMSRFPRESAIGLGLWALFAACQVPPDARQGRGGSALGDGGPDAARAAGDGACAQAKCDPLECGSGLLAIPLTGECCPTVCVPDDCSTVDCPPVECPSGTRSVVPNGRCCAECTTTTAPASSGTCAQGQQGYASFLSTLLASPSISSCAVDSDCRLVTLANACGPGCGTSASVRGAASLSSSANAYAAAHCAACPPAEPCPPVEQFPVCSGGVCTAY